MQFTKNCLCNSKNLSTIENVIFKNCPTLKIFYGLKDLPASKNLSIARKINNIEKIINSKKIVNFPKTVNIKFFHPQKFSTLEIFAVFKSYQHS